MVITIIALVSSFASALSPINAPECFVRGEIVNVEFKKAVDYSKPYLPAPSYPDRFALTILVEETNLIGTWEHNFSTCEDFYSVGEAVNIYIPTSDVKNESELARGNFIEGDIINMFGPFFRSYEIYGDNVESYEHLNKKNSLTIVFLSLLGFIIILLFIFFFLKKRK